MKPRERNRSGPPSWLSDPLCKDTKSAIEKIGNAKGVERMAIMPDVHLSGRTCVGMVVATQRYLYPEIVGGDIGCGITAIAFDISTDAIDNPEMAEQILIALQSAVPAIKHPSVDAPSTIPLELQEASLSDSQLEKLKGRDARLQLGTLGRGNHFLEFQTSPSGQLWLMVHSGSRGVGQRISQFHLHHAQTRSRGLFCLDEQTSAGQAYIQDLNWAIRYAYFNRLAIIQATAKLLERWGATPMVDTLVDTDHNHVSRETHYGNSYWVHRKGAQRAGEGTPGLIPGSMGTESYHVTGRGCPESLSSCSHGAGRAMRRKAAIAKISASDFERQMNGVWHDTSRIPQLIDEAPAAYRDIRKVMRAQRELVKITCVLTPVLNYKAR